MPTLVPPKPRKSNKEIAQKLTANREKAVAVVEKKLRKVQTLNDRVQADITRLMQMSTFEPGRKLWLDTGHPELNAVLGSRRRGICYGRIIELRGPNHGGKTAIAQLLAAMAQKDGAMVGHLDIEQSRDRPWAMKFRLDYDNVVRIFPKLLKRKPPKPPRLETAEELFEEAELAMSRMASYGATKQFWYVDSIAMLRTGLAIMGSKKQQKKGRAPERNMRGALDRAMFLSEKLPEWIGLAAAYNAIIVLVNQMRKNPGVVYGDPNYSPGGMAMEHACHVRANVMRLKNGKIVNGKQTIGLVTRVQNFKNKAGGKSVQGEECAVKIRWDRPRVRVRVMSMEDAEEALG